MPILNHPKKAALSYARALRKLLKGCGYGDVEVTVWDRKAIKRTGRPEGAKAAVVCEISGLELEYGGPGGVDFDGITFDLQKYGYTIPDQKLVHVEPESGCIVGFYEG